MASVCFPLPFASFKGKEIRCEGKGKRVCLFILRLFNVLLLDLRKGHAVA
jgi:hypothetical protein